MPNDGKIHLVFAFINFPTNATGFRVLRFKINEETSYLQSMSVVNASSTTTILNASWIIQGNYTGKTIELVAYQNSGSRFTDVSSALAMVTLN